MSQKNLVTRQTARVVALCFLVAVVDGYDAQSVGYVGPRLIEAFGIGPGALGVGFAAALVGLMIGAMTISVLADRHGRKLAILLSCGLMGVFSLLTAASPSFEAFIAFRFLTGLGLGGAMPCINALTAEHSSERWRTTLMTVMFMGVPVGAIAGGLLARSLAPALGWQSVFLIGGVAPLALAVALAIFLPNDKARNVSPAAPQQPLGLLSARLRWVSVSLWTIFFANLLIVYALVNWLPVLMEAAGVTPAQAILGPLVFNIGGIAGGAILAPVADRLGPIRVALVTFTGAAIAVALLGQLWPDARMLWGVAAVGVFVGGTQFIINAIAVSEYPAAMRASGIGAAMAVGRIGAIIGPLAVGLLLSWSLGLAVVYFAIAAAGILGAAASWWLARTHKRIAA